MHKKEKETERLTWIRFMYGAFLNESLYPIVLYVLYAECNPRRVWYTPSREETLPKNLSNYRVTGNELASCDSHAASNYRQVARSNSAPECEFSYHVPRVYLSLSLSLRVIRKLAEYLLLQISSRVWFLRARSWRARYRVAASRTEFRTFVFNPTYTYM